MNAERLEFFKNLFYSLLRDATKTEGLNLDQNATSDEVDKALEDRDNLMLLKLQGRQTFYIKKIADALGRIHNGTFGHCEECGEEIEMNRLMARPMTTMCIGCKEEEERVEGHVPYSKRSHTLGKTFNNENNVANFNADEVTNRKARILEMERKELVNGTNEFVC